MAHPSGAGHPWWDESWNPVFGCEPLSSGCLNCYAARAAGTLQTATEIPFYIGTTKKRGGRHVFNGKRSELPPGHPRWDFPRRYKGAPNPVLGPGMPSLLWACDMAELFLPRPEWVLDRVINRLVMSPDNIIGLILTKLPRQMAAYFNSLPEIMRDRVSSPGE
jgi:protein gp37